MTLLVTNFLAVLVIMALAGTVAMLVLAASGHRDTVREMLGARTALWLAALIAVTSMAGSLYLSEEAGFIPCLLCWYQRIAMYPLAILLPIAAVRGDDAIRPYAATLAGIGAVISAYHALLQRLPGLPSGSCSVDAPCTAIYVERFGFITIPVMALVGFLSILTLLLVTRERPSEVTS
jgi:disulfide bond formation protein DsbB